MATDTNPATANKEAAAWPRRAWTDLAELPIGMGGQAVGVLDGALVVAGGSYWAVDASGRQTKHYNDRVLVLRDPKGCWREASRLPHPVGYAAAAVVDGAFVLAGGENADGIQSATLQIELEHGRMSVKHGPPLAEPRRNAAAAVLHGAMYLCCGQTGEGNAGAVNELCRLENGSWISEPPLPAAPRILPAFASCDGCLLLMGGAAFEANGAREYLREQWSFRPDRGWRRETDLPYAVVAPPSLTMEGRAYVFGGDDGSVRDASPHSGFRPTVLEAGPTGVRALESEMPLGMVTSGAALWNGMMVVAGGEDRPGSRSARVLAWKAVGGEYA